MLSINMDDVLNVLTSIRSYLIAIGVIIAIAVVLMIAVMKLNKPVKKLVRGTALVAMLTGIVVCVKKHFGFSNLCNLKVEPFFQSYTKLISLQIKSQG